MNKQAKLKLDQRVINNLHHKLFHIEMRIKQGANGTELQLLEVRRLSIETRLMAFYYTEKYGLVQ
jgi:hypothetical protein